MLRMRQEILLSTMPDPKIRKIYLTVILYISMVFEIQSTDIGNINDHKFYQPIKDLEKIKANVSSVPNLRDTLMQISRIMFQDVLHNQVSSISIVKFDLDKFLAVWNIPTTALQVWHNEILKFINDNMSKTTKHELEFDIFENKHIFLTLYGFVDGDLPVNSMQHILSPVSFRDITYMKYAMPNIFEKTKWSETEYKDAFSTTNTDSQYAPEKLVEMLDNLFDNLMKSIDPYYDKEAHLRV